MSSQPPDKAAVRFPPPLVFVLAILLGIALYRWVAALPLDALGAARGPLALITFLAGTALVIAPLVLFYRSGQNPEPWKSTPELIFTGPYRLSRNPMYLAMALLQAGAALRFSNGWLLILLPLACHGVSRLAIRPEETYLEDKFGEPYRAYKASVRRWI